MFYKRRRMYKKRRYTRRRRFRARGKRYTRRRYTRRRRPTWSGRKWRSVARPAAFKFDAPNYSYINYILDNAHARSGLMGMSAAIAGLAAHFGSKVIDRAVRQRVPWLQHQYAPGNANLAIPPHLHNLWALQNAVQQVLPAQPGEDRMLRARIVPPERFQARWGRSSNGRRLGRFLENGRVRLGYYNGNKLTSKIPEA